MRASPHSPSRGSSLSSSWDGPSPAQWKKTCCKLFFKSLTGVKLFGHFLLHLNLFDRVSCNLSVVGCCEHCRVGRRGKGWRGQGGRQHGRGQRGLDLKDEQIIGMWLLVFFIPTISLVKNHTYPCYDWWNQPKTPLICCVPDTLK